MIYLLPTELSDNILIYLGDFNLAVAHHRFWAASQLFDIENIVLET